MQFFTDKKISFIDSLRLLPDASLGDKTWALAKLSVSNMRALPEDASELVSQVLMGTPLKVLDYVDKWYRVQTPEYYIGWMDTGGLQTFTHKRTGRTGKNRSATSLTVFRALLTMLPAKRAMW